MHLQQVFVFLNLPPHAYIKLTDEHDGLCRSCAGGEHCNLSSNRIMDGTIITKLLDGHQQDIEIVRSEQLGKMNILQEVIVRMDVFRSSMNQYFEKLSS